MLYLSPTDLHGFAQIHASLRSRGRQRPNAYTPQASKGVATCKNMSKFTSKFMLINYLHVDYLLSTDGTDDTVFSHRIFLISHGWALISRITLVSLAFTIRMVARAKPLAKSV